jgi:hypothetical protein
MAIIKNQGDKMRKATLSIFGILAMTIGLWATVPYTFTSNTPAKASEVNANFQSLSDKITTLEDNVSNIVSGGSDSSNCYASPYTYNYSYIPSNIGDTITLSSVEYIMVAMPFIEFSTGDHYYVKYPVKKQLSSLGMMLSASIGTSYVNVGNECFLYTTFAGFPANNYLSYYNNYSATMSDFAGANNYMISRSISSNVSVKINQTMLNLIMYLTNNIQMTPLSSGDVDMRDDINWVEMYNDTSLVDDMKTLMNYIEIVKIL